MSAKTPRPSYDRETLITAYIRHATARRDEDFWAWEAVGAVAHGPDAEAAWELMVELLRRIPDEELGYVAAGPFEDMVRLHAPSLIEWIEGEAKRDERFRWALGRIWLQAGELPAEIERRVVAASGGEIWPMPALPMEGADPP